MDSPLDLSDVLAEIVLTVNKQIIKDIRNNPTTRLLNLEDLTRDKIKDWLFSKGSTTWSVWSIYDEKSLEEATTWIQRELYSLYTFLYGLPS